MIDMDVTQTWLPYSLDDPVIDVLPNIFERPFLFVYSNTKLAELATYLAIGPQIYADGMLVFQQQEEDDEKQQKAGGGVMINRRKVVGRISGRHILCHIIKSDFTPYSDPLYAKTASEIMDAITNNEIIKKDSSLRRVIGLFKETRFAFLPIIGTPPLKGNNFSNDKNEEAVVIAALSIRDFLSLFTGAHRNKINNNINTQEKISIPVKAISSNLVSVSKYDTIKDAIDIMTKRGIRNIGIKDQNSDLVGLINERNILGFLLSPRWRLKEIIDSIECDCETSNNESTQINIKGEGIADSNHSNGNIGRFPSINSIINDLHIIPISEIKVEENITISKAAELLMDIHNPCLVLERENAIVTPWDIVMKTVEFSNK